MTEELPLFYPNRDALEDVGRAFERAAAEKKNVLIEIGGNWCIWCRRLEAFIIRHPELLYLRSLNFVHVRVHLAQSNDEYSGEPPPIFSRLPEIPAVPHFFVYNWEGKFLHSQETELLEDGDSYNYDEVWNFLAAWSSTTGYQIH